MRSLFYFSCIAVLAAFAGCTQSVMEPISQQPIVDIQSFFWKIGQAPAKFMDSIGNNYTLSFASQHDTLTVRDGTVDTFQCTVNQDSIYAFDYGLSRNLLFNAGDGSEFYEGLVLLRNNPFGNDSSWAAGTLFIKSTHSYPFTAHALAHFDTLQIATSVSGNNVFNKFPDVLMVSYQYEGNVSNSQDTIPHWIIYYAKNIGPIMVDKVTVTGSGASQTTAMKRHEIVP